MKQQLIIGMPGSGKSTYIAALRHVLLADDVQTELGFVGLADEERHLNDLEADWLRCKEVQRTKPATEGWVQFRVRDRRTGAEATISVPDLRGELFEQPACFDQCQKDLYDGVAAADGIVLFTNADREDDALMISDLGDLLGDDGLEEAEPINPFRPQDMPEEVKIVEFLQMANRRPLPCRRRRVAVLVSAWDVVKNGISPETWLASNRPMLAQFLKYNPELWDVRIYGVSAQGGRLPRDRARLAKIKNPSERINLVGHGAAPHDLTAPLQWLGSF